MNIWIATAVYHDSGIEPITVAATTRQLADQKIVEAVRASVADTENPDAEFDMWIIDGAKEVSVHDDPDGNAPAEFEVNALNVEAVHTYLEGAMEVESEENPTGERFTILDKAMNDSIRDAFPCVIIVPSWLACELSEVAADLD